MSDFRARQERLSCLVERSRNLTEKRPPWMRGVNQRLAGRLRRRLYSALHRSAKPDSAVRDLGCSIEYLRQRLQSMFKPGMSWDNYGHGKGCWTLDHIIPLSRVDLTNRVQFVLVCHYTNLQPLWFEENLRKGNRMPDGTRVPDSNRMPCVEAILRPGSIEDFVCQVIGPRPE